MPKQCNVLSYVLKETASEQEDVLKRNKLNCKLLETWLHIKKNPPPLRQTSALVQCYQVLHMNPATLEEVGYGFIVPLFEPQIQKNQSRACGADINQKSAASAE